MKKQKLIVLLGPTASGKSSLAIAIAKACNGEIIQADSRNVYRKMNIGTAKPVGDKKFAAEVRPEDVEARGIHEKHREMNILELFEEKPLLVEGIPHWGIDLVDPDEPFSVQDFKTYAEKKIWEIAKRGHVPILAGGTGLYIQAVVDNLQFTDTEPDLALRAQLNDLSNEELEHRLWRIDPEAAETIDVHNRRRLIRAIEVVEQSGKPLKEQQQKGEQMYDVLILGIERPREELYERIDTRVDQMIAEGLVDEVRALKEEYGCEVQSMTGIGYRQICAFLEGYMKLRDAIEVLKRDTRHYAKRQLTWFRRDERIEWIKNVDDAIKKIDVFLNK